MSASNKRIMNELAACNNNPLQGIKISLPDESNVYVWEAMMDGPSDSVYAGGHFKLQITLPKEYPFKPPIVSFKTKIYHPNVTNDEKGSMCLGILRGDTWKPPNRITEVLNLIRQTLIQPNPDDAVEEATAKQYRENHQEFVKTAKDWVRRYAH